MQSFKEYVLNENFKNLIGDADADLKKQYVDQVWDLLQATYSKIGGIKGRGFESKESMIANIPFWKLYIKNGKVLVAGLYKDKNGRKTVAYATDGTPKAKEVLGDLMKSSLQITYGEKSKGALIFMMKILPFAALEPFLLKPSEVKAITGDDIIIPDESYVSENLDRSDQVIYKKYKILKDYFYVRQIKDGYFLKVAMGTPYKSIT